VGHHTGVAVALTSLSHGAGCGCKLPAAAVGAVLSGLPAGPPDPNVLVGYDGADDAGVYRLSDELALVQTADFFTPIVDDPHDFGRIAACNALSDVYAMGGRPVCAVNLVAFSIDDLGPEVLGAILAGGASMAAEAGVAIVGGHSIDDAEPKYGMAVTGVVHPDRVLTNAGARAGDALVLTKPLGAGAVSTAVKRGLEAPLATAVEVMTTLNREAAEAAVGAGAHGMTDVTGFGLLGHLHELAHASGVSAVVDAGAVPAIPGVLDLLALEDGAAVAGGTRRNRAHAEAEFAVFADGVPEAVRWLVCDAMTSGGLLVALAPEAAPAIPGVVVGRLEDGAPGTITVA
jgi:selenide,water dikinase